MSNRYAFVAGDEGRWTVVSSVAVTGDGLPPARALEVLAMPAAGAPLSSVWSLLGLISNVRYATRSEITALEARQEGLGRDVARRAALIPIRKSPAWWSMAQDERRMIFEEMSHHTAIGLDYLPAIARRLFHARDLGQPFDFLTWFEYAPEHATAFEDLVARLRATREWSYVEREVDIRLERA